MTNISAVNLETLAVNTIRFLSVDAVQKAESGHPGLPLGAAPMAYALWTRHLHHNPRNPKWENRDRFILSAGHGSMLIYSLLYLTGYDLTLEDLKQFRQWGSRTPGHPEYGLTPGVETTTGPLGQGFANGVGMAMAEAFLAATFNRPGFELVDHYTYVLASDGDLMEGVASEAASLAGHLNLHKLIVLYDDNKVTLSAPTSITFTENVKERFGAYGWNTIDVADGNDVDAVSKAIDAARAEKERPTLISVRTIIGYGSPHKQGTFKAHGEPLGADEVKLTKEALGWPTDPAFYVPGEALEYFREALDRGPKWEAEWNVRRAKWAMQFPDLAKQWDAANSGEIPTAITAALPNYPAGGKPMATREINSVAINVIAKHLPTFIGGDADLVTSTRTKIDGALYFSPENYAGRNIAYGVREHAMGSITNGLTVHGGIIKPYTATFLTFSDYMRPPIRLAALMGLSPIFVFTHDSIGLGEDGPTHQPIEQLASLRAIPHLTVFRPADANEMIAAWNMALKLKGPVVIIGSRQKLPIFSPDGVMDGVAHGAYIKADSGGTPEVILLSAGSEVNLVMTAYDELVKVGIKARVVSMPSWELFRQQDVIYRNQVLPPAVTVRVAIEAGSPLGWHEWAGSRGEVIALNHFGASAPYEQLYQHYGLTAETVINAAHELLGR
ncbi:MAG TPA: transketolase [Aggregatilineales bacterium]|nr:transketolase [Aggregatilineales bacterium]